MTVANFLQIYEDHCGTSKAVFRGQLRAMITEIFDDIEQRAEAKMLEGHKLEGQHYAAMRAVRNELGCERKA